MTAVRPLEHVGVNDSMSDHWMPTIKLRVTPEQFHQLPRNPAYKYELLGGETWLSPRPKHYHALLALDARPPQPPPGSVRRCQDEDFTKLVSLFSGAFRTIQPFGSLDDDVRRRAAEEALRKTRTGGDGPWIREASFVALEHHDLAGAILITLLPDRDPTSWDSFEWVEPPPPDCIERRAGRPHLTWVFVAARLAGQGIGTTLLAAATNALAAMGFHDLLSTFMIGNDSSLLWHWRNGFRLLAHPASRRQMRPLVR